MRSFIHKRLLVHADLYQSRTIEASEQKKLLKAKKILPDEPVITLLAETLFFQCGKYGFNDSWLWKEFDDSSNNEFSV